MIERALEEDLRRHDEALAKLGLRIWVGGEPTFTDRFATGPEWRSAALGGDKEARGEKVLEHMAARLPGAAVLRTAGRQYAGEDAPRWSKGVYARRDGEAVWSGPPDPCLGGTACEPAQRTRLHDAIAARLGDGSGALRVGYLGDDDAEVENDEDGHARPAHTLLVGVDAASGVARVDLPAFESVDAFLDALAVLAAAAGEAKLSGLVFTGEGPPVDASVWWTTVTPDPGVLEINLAPASSAVDFARDLDAVYADAASADTAAYCLHFNGDVADSGGGGHITIGGPSPAESPFALYPDLVPRLVAYFVRHPALSYLFADQAGSSSQAPRVDETSRETLGELALALHLLMHNPERSLETTWRSLAPFLTDRFGNTHRCEMNVEKLCNPYLPRRGKLGVIELRALRMPEDPGRWAARAALFRAIVARCAVATSPIVLKAWSSQELHDRFALPFFQRQDLREIFGDLEACGVGLGPALVANLLSDPHRVLCELTLPGCEIVIRRATEFWPLVGDLSSQDGTSRLIDPSCRRIEILVRPTDDTHAAEWSLAIEGVRVPASPREDDRGAALVLGVRTREFVPNVALHPLLPARATLELVVGHPKAGARRLTLHGWRPDGGAYDGMPASIDDATARRRERVVIEEAKMEELLALPEAPSEALTEHTLDVRWLPPRG